MIETIFICILVWFSLIGSFAIGYKAGHRNTYAAESKPKEVTKEMKEREKKVKEWENLLSYSGQNGGVADDDDEG